jgi:hypothetical protein
VADVVTEDVPDEKVVAALPHLAEARACV